jgi:hypothetical protein
MATYAELFELRNNSDLRNRVAVACIVESEAIRTEPATTSNHNNRMAWAKAVFENPDREADRMMWAILAQNKSATPAQITGAPDATVQTAVHNAVDVFATGA